MNLQRRSGVHGLFTGQWGVLLSLWDRSQPVISVIRSSSTECSPKVTSLTKIVRYVVLSKLPRR